MDNRKLNEETKPKARPKTLPENSTTLPAAASVSVPPVVPTPGPARPMKKGRFLSGMLLSGGGIALMLAVAAGALQSYGISGRMSLPAVGLCMIIGVMLLGGGFGIMATSAGTFDDEEFERLMNDGDAVAPARVAKNGVSDLPAFREEPTGRNSAERQSGSEQAVA